MGLNIGKPFPDVPANVQPSDVPSPIPGESERELGAPAPEQLDLPAVGQDDVSQEPQQLPDLPQEPQASPLDSAANAIGAVESVARFSNPVTGGIEVYNWVSEKIESLKAEEKNRIDASYQGVPPNGTGPSEEEQISQREIDLKMSLVRLKQEMSPAELKAASMVSEENTDEALADEAEQMLLDLRGQTFAPEGTRPESEFQNFMLRAVGSMGLSDDEALRPLVKAFGPENVTQRDGEVYYRERKGKPFVKYDESDFTVADVIADNFGAILETGVAIPTELGLLAGAGAAATTGVGALAAPGIALSAPGVGAVAGVGARRLAFPDEYQDKDASIGSEMAFSVGMSYALPGMIKGLGKGSKWIGQKMLNALDSSPKVRAKKIAESMVELEESVKVLSRRTGAAPQKDLASAAKAGYGAIDQYQKELGNAVGAIKDDAIRMGGDQTFEPTYGLAKIREELADNNVLFKKNGEAVFFDPDAAVDDVFIDDEGLLVLTDGAKNIKRKLTQEQFNKEFGFGAKGGSVVLNRLVNQYNKILRKVDVDGGVPVKSIQDMVDIYTDMSKFGKDQAGNILQKKERRLARNIRNAMGEDRNRAFTDIFKQAGEHGPEGTLWRETFNEFSERNADFNELSKFFNKKDTALDFGRELFKSKKHAEAFKTLVGGDSHHWNNVRNEWLLDTFKKAKDPNTGLFLANKWNANFKKVVDNEELASVIFDDPSELASVKRLVKNVGDIPFGDLVTPAKARNIIQDFVRIGISDHLMPQTRAEILWGWFGKNVDLTPEMLDGLMDEAKKAGTRSARNRIFETASRMKYFIANSKIVQYTVKHPVTKKIQKVNGYAPLGAGKSFDVAPAKKLLAQQLEEVGRLRVGQPTRSSFERVIEEEGGGGQGDAQAAGFQPASQSEGGEEVPLTQQLLDR